MRIEEGEAMGHVINRAASWIAIVGLGLYILNIGQWVGAAEEKFENAQKVEDQVDDLKDRLTRVEEKLDSSEKRNNERTDMILDAIKDLEKKVAEENDG